MSSLVSEYKTLVNIGRTGDLSKRKRSSNVYDLRAMRIVILYTMDNAIATPALLREVGQAILGLTYVFSKKCDCFMDNARACYEATIGLRLPNPVNRNADKSGPNHAKRQKDLKELCKIFDSGNITPRYPPKNYENNSSTVDDSSSSNGMTFPSLELLSDCELPLPLSDIGRMDLRNRSSQNYGPIFEESIKTKYLDKHPSIPGGNDFLDQSLGNIDEYMRSSPSMVAAGGDFQEMFSAFDSITHKMADPDAAEVPLLNEVEDIHPASINSNLISDSTPDTQALRNDEILDPQRHKIGETNLSDVSCAHISLNESHSTSYLSDFAINEGDGESNNMEMTPYDPCSKLKYSPLHISDDRYRIDTYICKAKAAGSRFRHKNSVVLRSFSKVNLSDWLISGVNLREMRESLELVDEKTRHVRPDTMGAARKYIEPDQKYPSLFDHTSFSLANKSEIETNFDSPSGSFYCYYNQKDELPSQSSTTHRSLLSENDFSAGDDLSKTDLDAGLGGRRNTWTPLQIVSRRPAAAGSAMIPPASSWNNSNSESRTRLVGATLSEIDFDFLYGRIEEFLQVNQPITFQTLLDVFKSQHRYREFHVADYIYALSTFASRKWVSVNQESTEGYFSSIKITRNERTM